MKIVDTVGEVYLKIGEVVDQVSAAQINDSIVFSS